MAVKQRTKAAGWPGLKGALSALVWGLIAGEKQYGPRKNDSQRKNTVSASPIERHSDKGECENESSTAT